MEKYDMVNDLHMLCVTAASFPDGISDAFDKLKSILPANDVRTRYGISKPEKNGTIVYKAAVVEAFEGEALQHKCETYLLKKGTYSTETITEWNKKLDSIMPTFYTLLKNPKLDPDTPCVEWYNGDDAMVCMVKLKN